MRAWAGALVVAGAVLVVVFFPRERPYPYPVAYKFGFDYREASLKEERWQASLAARFAGVDPAVLGKRGVKLKKFYPRYPDSEEGAVRSWRERRTSTPILYVDEKTKAPREPTEGEAKLEREGWVAGYLDSVRRHPHTD
jgi:hypothetical protein